MFTGDEDGLQFAIRAVRETSLPHRSDSKLARRRGPSPDRHGFETCRRIILEKLVAEQKRRLDARLIK